MPITVPATQVERVAEGLAAAILSGSVAFVLLGIDASPEWTALGAMIAGAAAYWSLRQVKRAPSAMPLPDFALAALPGPVGECEPGGYSPDGELLLDDVLVPVAPESRVVRLFSGGRLPTPGELSRTIDCHLGAERGGTPESAPRPAGDQSEALFQALAELREALR